MTAFCIGIVVSQMALLTLMASSTCPPPGRNSEEDWKCIFDGQVDKSYLFTNVTCNYDRCISICASQEAVPATIPNQLVHNSLLHIYEAQDLASPRDWWLGLYQIERGKWAWSNGLDVDFSKWFPEEPNAYPFGEPCSEPVAQMRPADAGQFHDTPAHARALCICEFVEAPMVAHAFQTAYSQMQDVCSAQTLRVSLEEVYRSKLTLVLSILGVLSAGSSGLACLLVLTGQLSCLVRHYCCNIFSQPSQPAVSDETGSEEGVLPVPVSEEGDLPVWLRCCLCFGMPRYTKILIPVSLMPPLIGVMLAYMSSIVAGFVMFWTLLLLLHVSSDANRAQ